MSTNGNVLSAAGKDLLGLLASRTHVVAIDTVEEQRVLRDLRTIAQKLSSGRGVEVVTWSCVRGLLDAQGKEVGNKLYMPSRALAHILEVKDRPCLYALCDLNEYWKNPDVARGVREIDMQFSRLDGDALSYAVIIGAGLQLPISLEDHVTVLEYSLPTVSELTSVAEIGKRRIESSGVASFGADPAQVAQVGAGLTEAGMRRSIMHSLTLNRRVDLGHIGDSKRRAVEKSGVLRWWDDRPDLSSVGGLDLLIEWFNQRKVAFFDEKAREQYGLPYPRGTLLVGVPGCGKSLACKAVASAWGLPLLRLDMGSLMSSLLGSSEANLRRALEVAEVTAPVVLWVDEIEKAVSGAGGSGETDGGVSTRMFGTLLSWMNDKTAPVFVAATANNIRTIPPELLRKGRFDEIFWVGLPSAEDRKKIFSIHLTKRGWPKDKYDLNTIAARSRLFSGAEIESAVEEALFLAYASGGELTTEHLLASCENIRPMAETMKENIQVMTEWAENNARPAASDSSASSQSGGEASWL